MSLADANFSDEFKSLLNTLQTQLYFVVNAVESREQAIVVKGMMQQPLGILNSKFCLASNSSKYRRTTPENKLTKD